jgi:hypothetical protein
MHFDYTAIFFSIYDHPRRIDHQTELGEYFEQDRMADQDK